MCLSRVQKKEPTTKGFGYKAFDRGYHHKGLISICQGRVKAYPLRKWVNESGYRRVTCAEQAMINHEYPFGFHISTSLRGAKEWSGDIYEVQYRKAHTKGSQLGYHCIVATEMKILREVK